MKHRQLFTTEPGVRDGQICYLWGPIECVKGIRDWQDGIYSTDYESWRWEGNLRGVLLSAMPPLHLAIGCFYTTTTDSPFQPGQLVKKRSVLFSFPQRSLSATDLFNCKEMFSSTPGTPVHGAELYISSFFIFPLSSASALAPSTSCSFHV